MVIHREFARAKVNLTLRVLGKREDGFHALESRMAPISLGDDLLFSEAEDFELVCDAVGVPVDESNLVTKAVRVFQRETGRACRYRVELVKRVPHGAGLGGGSGDAGAVLRGLNILEKTGLGMDRLAEMAAEVGSDVPFFVYDSVCDVSGRGEVVVPIDWGHEVEVLLLKPSFGVDTPDAYRAWAGSRELCGIEYGVQEFGWGEMVNDLERPVFGKHRFLAELKMWLLEQPEVEGALMSGSGSTMIAILRGDGEVLKARARVEMDPTLWGEVVVVG